MTKHVHNGTTWKPVISGGYYIKDPTVLKQVDHSWVWDGTTWKKYYTKAVDVVLDAVINSWEMITVSWSMAAPEATYILKRDGVPIYGPGNNQLHVDNLLMPQTNYVYTVEAYLGPTLLSSDTISVATYQYPPMGFTATAASYSTINLAWNAKNPSDSSISEFWLARDGTSGISKGLETSHTDTGLVSGTPYGYTVQARRAGTVIASATASATTSVRPTSTGSWNGPAATTSGGWTSCTARNLNGPTFPMPVNGYISSWNVLVWSYGTAMGHFDPHIAGQYRGRRNCPGGRGFQHVDGGNIYVTQGNQSTGAATGGNCSYSTEWDAYAGVSWNYNVAIGTINFWWYTALARESMSTQPWWTDELDNRSIHMETWGVGELTKVQISDKRTKSIIVDWQSDDHDELLYVE